MPIKVQSDLPVRAILEQENIFVMDETRALNQNIRPLKIGCLLYTSILLLLLFTRFTVILFQNDRIKSAVFQTGSALDTFGIINDMRRFPLAGNGVHRTVAGTLGTALALVRIDLVYAHGLTYVSRALQMCIRDRLCNELVILQTFLDNDMHDTVRKSYVGTRL